VTAKRVALLGLALMAATTSAHAHGESAIIGPLVAIAVLCGGISAVVSGSLGRSEGYGLGIAFGVLTLIVLALLAVFTFHESLGLSDFLGALLMAVIAVGFAGAIPLAVTYLALYKLTAYVRRRVRHDAKSGGAAP
jgi:uncharacterized membrane protein